MGAILHGDCIEVNPMPNNLVRATYDQMLEYGRRQMYGPAAVERRRRLRAAARRR